ncbi:lipid IV(A) 3-deoxy-D-manno-octulosonic acid transferase [Halomonas urumqiensis]|uniref:3-deoxy-D-manno-octulosonic acid transferase n=1 Tax=Halomonas urumqiensis TaxID=1684789 RepID=A0A2N7UK79_9GAMM|nr:lipid IV(A) 3-deoxy-D-manno-octulosonic acid transferase [Halomonas urumqiensis]PMR80809.1 3-deoxy-D-manno-octulosonic acid transferase [Halomonas urumqiensis]PTB02766.1 3-deoxy-D-manno-octulosonic acid transferase [Halomonas urumqiensis]GHE21268.1 3-deoxy-D-manno-octulosonic acid transferase [Halomonas urumqiensis]
MGWGRYLYSAALYGASPLIWRRIWSEQVLTHPRRQRLGLIPPTPPGARMIWLHCASVGEVQAARPLIQALLARYPAHRLTVTTMTATGAERVLALVDAQDDGNAPVRLIHRFVPLDFPGAARRFVERLDPVVAVFFETELWPNLLHACQRQGVPVMVANGRLSPRAYRGYRRVAALMREALGHVDWLAAKSAADAERFQALGMPASKIAVVGSLKFDITPDAWSIKVGESLLTCLRGRPVWVAGSTHAGEDEQLLAAHARLRKHLPDALLILVPRHPHRFEPVAALCENASLAVARRSRAEWPGADTAVYLGDTMGELLSLYAAADLAFVGGSLVPIGGHNLLEPAAMGVPVLSGPEIANFVDVAEVLRNANALVEVSDAEDLAETLERLFNDAQERARLAKAGRQVVEANRGALARTTDGLARLIDGE